QAGPFALPIRRGGVAVLDDQSLGREPARRRVGAFDQHAKTVAERSRRGLWRGDPDAGSVRCLAVGKVEGEMDERLVPDQGARLDDAAHADYFAGPIRA